MCQKERQGNRYWKREDLKDKRGQGTNTNERNQTEDPKDLKERQVRHLEAKGKDKSESVRRSGLVPRETERENQSSRRHEGKNDMFTKTVPYHPFQCETFTAN